MFEVVVNQGVVVSENDLEIAGETEAVESQRAKEGTREMIRREIKTGGAGGLLAEAPHELGNFLIDGSDLEVADVRNGFAKNLMAGETTADRLIGERLNTTTVGAVAGLGGEDGHGAVSPVGEVVSSHLTVFLVVGLDVITGEFVGSTGHEPDAGQVLETLEHGGRRLHALNDDTIKTFLRECSRQFFR